MPDHFFAIFVILYGLAFGSFVKAAIDRLSHEESLRGRSYCPCCKKQLAIKDLIPLISWLLLQGRCRYCHAKIAISYPLTELFTAVLFYWLWRTFGVSWLSVSYCCIITLLIIIAGIDIRTMEIPNSLNLMLAVSALPILLSENNAVLSSLLGAAAAALPLAVIAACTGGIGGGDVKLMAAAGLTLGAAKILLALFLGCLSAAVFAVVMILSKKLHWKSYLPLAPFLALGIIITIFYGNGLLSWYKTFF